ncbi:MAG: hypothetical protein ACYTAF_12720 [Planctomycetota bacterium]|jgi:protein-arginine kinase activator protein McsA
MICEQCGTRRADYRVRKHGTIRHLSLCGACTKAAHPKADVEPIKRKLDVPQTRKASRAIRNMISRKKK